MKYETENIAESLRRARKAKGLSQRELSALAGIPQAQISRIEAGEVDLRLSSLIGLAHALGLEIELIPGNLKSLVRSLRNDAAHDNRGAKSGGNHPRPAYALDEDDDNG